jgi:sugar phosphate permease
MQLMIYWGMTTWIAFFLVKAHGYDIKTMGVMAGLPYVAAIIAQYFGGVAADKFFGGRPRILCLISYLGCVPVLYLLGRVPQGQTLPLLVLLLLGGFFINLNWSVIQAYPSYRYPKEVVGRAMGFSNGIGQFGAFLSPLLAGYLVIQENGTSVFEYVFLFWAITSVIAALCFYFLKETPIEETPFLIQNNTP